MDIINADGKLILVKRRGLTLLYTLLFVLGICFITPQIWNLIMSKYALGSCVGVVMLVIPIMMGAVVVGAVVNGITPARFVFDKQSDTITLNGVMVGYVSDLLFLEVKNIRGKFGQVDFENLTLVIKDKEQGRKSVWLGPNMSLPNTIAVADAIMQYTGVQQAYSG